MAMNAMPIKVLHIHFGKDGGVERFFVIRPRRKWRDEIEDLGKIIENHYRRLTLQLDAGLESSPISPRMASRCHNGQTLVQSELRDLES